MPKCNKTKKPCKICLGPVTDKTGLQCQGACQTWVHYGCLNYTPGKIKDIKAGIIKVTCPCPDCKTTLPKEYRTDEPFSCNNTQCPANQTPKCGNITCPTNNGTSGTEQRLPTSAGCALDKCGKKTCKTYSHPRLPDTSQTPPVKPCAPPKYSTAASPAGSKDACLDFKPPCPSGCASATDVPGDFGRQTSPIIPSLGTLEQMCNTVGQLTNQINNLMAKMQQAANEKSGGGCSQKGPKSLCPKPCFCPGNPGRRI